MYIDWACNLHHSCNTMCHSIVLVTRDALRLANVYMSNVMCMHAHAHVDVHACADGSSTIFGTCVRLNRKQ